MRISSSKIAVTWWQLQHKASCGLSNNGQLKEKKTVNAMQILERVHNRPQIGNMATLNAAFLVCTLSGWRWLRRVEAEWMGHGVSVLYPIIYIHALYKDLHKNFCVVPGRRIQAKIRYQQSLPTRQLNGINPLSTSSR